MKKLLILLLLSISLSAFADSHLDFSLSGFCFQQPGIQDRGDVLYFPNKVVGITATSVCVYKDAYGQYESKGELINGKQEGWWTWWKDNGEVLKKEQYFEGYKKGYKQMTFNGYGQIELEKIYEYGSLVGETKYYYEDGLIYSKDNFKDGNKVSETRYEYQNGQKIMETNWAATTDGFIEHGKWSEWSKNGQKYSEGNYKDGIKDGKWTWWGPLHWTATFKDGKLDGKAIIWHKNGLKKEEQHHQDGVKHGKWTYWHENGQMWIKGYYWDDKLSGKWTAWHENGLRSSEKNYKDGVKVGEWTMWYENGYMIENGSYNSIGRKDGKWSHWLWFYTEDWHKRKPELYESKEAFYKNGKCISGDCDYKFIR